MLAEGGNVVDRAAKSVTPSPGVRAGLGIPPEAPAGMTPAELIRWILKAPVDLLWNGGIGTYVKASEENHQDARGRMDDGLPVEGRGLPTRGVCEGGDPRFTQRGRREYPRSGGRVYTQFLD